MNIICGYNEIYDILNGPKQVKADTKKKFVRGLGDKRVLIGLVENGEEKFYLDFYCETGLKISDFITAGKWLQESLPSGKKVAVFIQRKFGQHLGEKIIFKNDGDIINEKKFGKQDPVKSLKVLDAVKEYFSDVLYSDVVKKLGATSTFKKKTFLAMTKNVRNWKNRFSPDTIREASDRVLKIIKRGSVKIYDLGAFLYSEMLKISLEPESTEEVSIQEEDSVPEVVQAKVPSKEKSQEELNKMMEGLTKAKSICNSFTKRSLQIE